MMTFRSKALSYPQDFSTNGKAVVTSVRRHPRRQDRYIVELEGDSGSRFKATISDEMFARNVYREGDEIDCASFLYESSRTVAFDTGVDILARRSCSSMDIQRGLERRGLARQVAAEAVERLATLGLVDDARFAASFVRSRLGGRKASAWSLRRDLAKKGVAREIADAAIAAGMSEAATDEVELARHEAAKKWKRLSSLEPVVARRRLGAFLQRRGFPGDVVRTVIKDLQRKSDEE